MIQQSVSFHPSPVWNRNKVILVMNLNLDIFAEEKALYKSHGSNDQLSHKGSLHHQPHGPRCKLQTLVTLKFGAFDDQNVDFNHHFMGYRWDFELEKWENPDIWMKMLRNHQPGTGNHSFDDGGEATKDMENIHHQVPSTRIL